VSLGAQQVDIVCHQKLLVDDSRPKSKQKMREVSFESSGGKRWGLVVHFQFCRRKSKRYSAFGGNSPFGKLEAYVKLEQLGEGSYATVFKGTPTHTASIRFFAK
jgi:cyclin-dependent kinase 14